jgi:hypothetical protein
MRESPIPARQTQSAFHPHAQRNAFRRRYARWQLAQFTIKTNLKQSEEFEDNHEGSSGLHARLRSDDSAKVSP